MSRGIDKQQVVILAAAAVLLGGFVGIRYVPALRQRQALAARIEEQRLELEEIRTYSELLPGLKSQEDSLKTNLEQFARKIPRDRDFASLWQQIADAMNACRLRDQWVQPGTETQTGRFCCIPLTIEGKGSLEQVFAFLKAIEGMDRLIRMEDVTLENGKDYDADLKMSARAAVYYLPATQ